MTGRHEASRLVIGRTGNVVMVSERICAQLEKFGLDDARLKYLGHDDELDATLRAIHWAALNWRSSRTGTAEAPQPEPARESWVSTTQAASHLHMTDRGIRKAIEEGRLSATRVDDRWRIDREELAHFRARQTQKGNR